MKFKKAFIGLMTAAVLVSSVFFGACTDKGDEGNGEGNNPPSDYVPPAAEIVDKTVETTKLTVYEAPNLLTSSSALKAYVEGEELFVYDTRVNHGRTFTYAYSRAQNQVVNFDFEGKVHMKVEVQDTATLSEVTIRPSSYGVEPKVEGNVIEFDLQYSANYTLEYLTDKDAEGADPADNALHIFANPIEENPITEEQAKEDDSIIYIGPGVYKADAIPMASGQTLYLAGGAYVYGQVRAENLENITIRGRGMFSGEIYSRTKDSEFTLPIELRFCKNVKIEGITMLDPAGWAVTLLGCDGVETDNVKIITARGNGDGWSVQSCKNVNIKGGFVRTWDDTLVVKNTDRGTTSNVTFDNVTVWTDLAQSMEVGFETNGATMDKITFKNITVLHNYHKAVMSIHNADDAVVTNITYQNITIEDAQMFGDTRGDGENDFLLDIKILYDTNWSKADNRGTVSNVTVENVKILETLPESITCLVNGEDADSNVSNVVIRGIEAGGVALDTKEKLKLSSNAYASGITVSGINADVTGAMVKLPYNIDLKDENVAKTVVASKTQNGLEVPEFAILKVQELYMGAKHDLSEATVTTRHGYGDSLSPKFYEDDTFGDASNVLDGNRSTAYTGLEWNGDKDEFAAITINFGKTIAPGVIRIYLAEDNSYVTNFKISVFTKADATSTKYVRSMAANTYTATPATGSYFDIKLSSKLKCELVELRFFRVDGMMGQQTLSINEIAFYPSSLSTSAAIVGNTENGDVRYAKYLVDGDENTYYEAARLKDESGNETVWQDAYVTVDLGKIYDKVQYISMHLPPILTWEARTQEISIEISTDNQNWTTVQEKKAFLFDPVTGNSNSVKLETPVQARYVRINFYSNSSKYGAQLSELYVYEG